MQVIQKINELEEYFPHFQETNTTISSKSLGWHIDHSLKVIISICQVLQKSDPATYRKDINFHRLFIFPTGTIPRGRGKAPKPVVSKTEIRAEALTEQFDAARSSIEVIQQLPENSHFKHVVFGRLNRKKSEQFLSIHTEHHLKIIRDILTKH